MKRTLIEKSIEYVIFDHIKHDDNAIRVMNVIYDNVHSHENDVKTFMQLQCVIECMSFFCNHNTILNDIQNDNFDAFCHLFESILY